MPWTAQTIATGKSFAPVALTTSAQVIYTAPAYSGTVSSGTGNGNVATAKVIEFKLSNTNTSGNVTFTVHKVPSGGSPSVSNAIYYQIPFKNNPDTIELSGLNTLLSPGETIQALASTTGVNITVSVVEYA
jgi:hypothetical protein